MICKRCKDFIGQHQTNTKFMGVKAKNYCDMCIDQVEEVLFEAVHPTTEDAVNSEELWSGGQSHGYSLKDDIFLI